MSRVWLIQALLEQVTPASCWWVQLLCFPHPSCLQFQRADSLPRQETWSIQMRPEPPLELVHPAALMKVGHPSCLQITETSSRPQPLLHTVPHSSCTFTSTLPEHLSSPAASLSSLSVPPATVDKGSSWSRSKEQVENYYSLDYLLVFQTHIWETFLDPSMVQQENAISWEFKYKYWYHRLQIEQWHKSVKLTNTLPCNTLPLWVIFFIMSIYIIFVERLLFK